MEIAAAISNFVLERNADIIRMPEICAQSSQSYVGR
jgi:hypothetical protein